MVFFDLIRLAWRVVTMWIAIPFHLVSHCYTIGFLASFRIASVLRRSSSDGSSQFFFCLLLLVLGW